MSNDLINRSALIKEIDSLYPCDYGGYGDYRQHDGARKMQQDCLTIINEQPTVDAVEIVRCKDCEHRDENCCVDSDTYCEITRGYMDDNDYCIYGKRKVARNEIN